MPVTVSVVKCEDYAPSAVFRAVREAVALLGGMDKFIRPGQKVLLKPNLLSPRPAEDAVCTHPSIVGAVAGLTTAFGGDCFFGDSPSIGGETPEKYERLLKITGMREVTHRAGISTVRFDDCGTEREVSDAKVFRRLPLTDFLDQADLLINLPKFKTHALTLLSGAVKNLFGCVPGRRKAQFHLQAGDNPEMFAQLLVDVMRAVRPGLSIMDGIVGMDGDGPSAGRRRSFGLIFASADPVALDAVACTVAGVNPLTIPTLRLASEQGAGVADLGDIEVLGERIEDVRIEDFQLPSRGDLVSRIPKPIYRMLRNHLVASPAFLRERCTGCHECVEICPVNAIRGEDTKLNMNYSSCIRCYCCHEVCPEEEIYLRTNRLSDSIETLLAVRRRIKRIVQS